MTDEKSLTIKTVTVEIHVIRVDGHKMTKATWDQIQEGKGPNWDNILGWVHSKNKRKYILYKTSDGKLRKTAMNEYGIFYWDGNAYSFTHHPDDKEDRKFAFEIVSKIEKRFPQLYIAT